MVKEGLKGGVIAYYHSDGAKVTLAVLTFSLGVVAKRTAAFEVAIGVPGNDLILTRPGTSRSAVSITLNALAKEGTYTWTINGKEAKATTSIPDKEFEKLKELVITHKMTFGHGTHAVNIGIAACRESECKYVWNLGFA